MKKLILVCSLLIPAPALRAQNFTRVNILIPRFQSPKGSSADVGRRSAAILGLQIWRTYSNPEHKKAAFDNAEIIFDTEHRPTSYAEAETFARRRKKSAHLVLWGMAAQYGDGVVVEANLLVRKGVGKNNLGTNIWSVTVPTGHPPRTISVDIPAWQYEFAPIVLDPNLIKAFESETRRMALNNNELWRRADFMGVGIYSMPSTASDLVGDFSGKATKAIEHRADWSRVEILGEGTGWVYLPKLSQSPSEVVSFCSGIIRFLRNDLSGAISMFQEVLENGNSPTAVKIDSYLYMAIAYDKMHLNEKSFQMIAKAYQLNPYSKATTQYLCMSYLTKLARLLPRDAEGPETKKVIESIQELLSKNKVLFAEDDKWIIQVEQILTDLAS